MGTQKGVAPGTRIREYEILEMIGAGGMGAVYRARHVLLDEVRAIKLIQARLADESEFTERFIREAKILVKLHHPNLIQLYEFGTLEDETLFMVLEYVKGESVLSLMQRQERIPVSQAIKIAREAALGLHCAHQQGIIHRDISPDNLLLVKTETGGTITKVIDFGIAKPTTDASHGPTMTNVFIGKPEYSSPEQCGSLEEGEKLDSRSDIYSLGITFYFMLAGRLPYYATTPQGYIVKHASSEPKTLSKNFEPGSCPQELERIVMKMLSKDRKQRYQDLQQFVNDLNNFEKDPTKTPIPTAKLPETIEYKEKTAEEPPSSKSAPPARAAITLPLPSKSRLKTILIVAGFLLAAIYAATLYLDHRTESVRVSPVQKLPVKYKLHLPLVTIDALPWAKLKLTMEETNPLFKGIPPAEVFTPSSLFIPPGHYILELTNNETTTPIIEKIEVESSKLNNFVFTMPGYDPQEVLMERRKLDPSRSNPKAVNMVEPALLAFYSHQFRQAQDLLQLALKYEDTAELHFYLGATYMSQGWAEFTDNRQKMRDLAMSEFAKAHQLDPKFPHYKLRVSPRVMAMYVRSQ
jgi:eukaryotic-like serine/threonine-protein kinase